LRPTASLVVDLTDNAPGAKNPVSSQLAQIGLRRTWLIAINEYIYWRGYLQPGSRCAPLESDIGGTLAADVIVANAPDPVFVLAGKITAPRRARCATRSSRRSG